MPKALSLGTPIRVYWDMRAGADDPNRKNDIGNILTAVAEKLTQGKIFYLSISGWEDIPYKIFYKTLLDLHKNGILVSLICSSNKIFPERELFLYSGCAREFIFEISSEKDLPKLSSFRETLKKTPAKISASIHLHKKNHGRIDSIIEYCVKNGVRDIIIPIPEIVDRPEVSALSHSFRKKIARIINGSLLRRNDDLNFIIHDPFLWRLLDTKYLEGKRVSFEGCQAADSIAYVDSKGNVYPCALLPIKLGNLLQLSLKEIWSSKEKKIIRKKIETIPQNCKNCSLSSECKGGCKGLSFLINNDINSEDPTCPVSHP